VRPLTLITLAATTVLSLLLVVFRTVPPQTLAGGLLLMWVSLIPILLYVQGVARDPLPFASYVGAYYLVFFALPVFAAPLAFQTDGKVVLYHRVALEPPGVDVLGLAAAGILSMLAAFYASRRILFAQIPTLRLRTSDLPQNALNLLYAVLLIASLAYRYVPMLQSMPSIGQFLDPAGYLAFGGFFLQWRNGCLAKWLLLALLALAVPLELYWRLRYLFVTDFLLLLVFFAFVLWRARQFKFLVAIIGVGIISSLGYTATGGARGEANTLLGKLSAMTAYVAGAMGGEPVVDDGRAGVGRVSSDPRISRLINRIGQIWIFQHVYERSPDPVPYLGGQTYRPLLTAVIPRVIYPNKPEERAGAIFGYHYGFTETERDSTSFNIPWMTELLANFGAAGVVIGMGLFGLFLAFLNRAFNAPGMSDPEFLIGLAIIYRLGYQESNLSVMTGSLPLLFVSLYIYFRLGAALSKRISSVKP
jgi:hypothetical protein